MDRAHSWWGGTEVRWVPSEKTFIFPSGARITFGYLLSERDKYRYQSAEFHFIGIDETTQFPFSQYSYLFSRLRKQRGCPIPLRMRSATNPGNVGHQWYKDRFVTGTVPFVQAKLDDNPSLDKPAYIRSLNKLDPITRAQLLEGNWDITEEGMFKRQWFQFEEDYPRGHPLVRYWDLAATEAAYGTDPDWTVGVLMTIAAGQFWIIDVQRFRASPKETEDNIKNQAIVDGKEVAICMEEEGGSSGKSLIDHYQRNVLVGYVFRGIRPTGSKAQRAAPLASAVEAKNVKVVVSRDQQEPWLNTFLDELCLFPKGSHDDQVDAASGAFNELAEKGDSEFDVCFGKVSL